MPLSMMRFAWLSGLVATLVWHQPIAEAGPPERNTRAEARRLFETAKTALQSGRFPEARDLLQRSLSMHPNRASAFNLAVALRGTGEALAALEVLDDLLDGRYGPLDKEERAQVKTMQASAARVVGTIVVSAAGAPGAAIRIDGEARGRVKEGGPLRLRVDPGHRVVSAVAGMRRSERRVLVKPGARVEVQLTLRPAVREGTLLVQASEPAAEVEIVGIARGRGSLKRRLAEGSYHVRARHEGVLEEQRVAVKGGRWVSVRLSPRRSLFKSPWFWIATSAVVIGGVVATVLVATRTDEAEGPIPKTYTLGIRY